MIFLGAYPPTHPHTSRPQAPLPFLIVLKFPIRYGQPNRPSREDPAAGAATSSAGYYLCSNARRSLRHYRWRRSCLCPRHNFLVPATSFITRRPLFAFTIMDHLQGMVDSSSSSFNEKLIDFPSYPTFTSVAVPPATIQRPYCYLPLRLLPPRIFGTRPRAWHGHNFCSIRSKNAQALLFFRIEKNSTQWSKPVPSSFHRALSSHIRHRRILCCAMVTPRLWRYGKWTC